MLPNPNMSIIHHHHLLLLVLLIIKTMEGAAQHCSPSSCGNLKNISYPFRLRGDPPDCGLPELELTCTNNRAILHLNSKPYYVEEINYQNFSIRLVDPGLQKGNCSSFPQSLSLYEVISTTFGFGVYNSEYPPGYAYANLPVIFITCNRTPANSSVHYVADSCDKNTTHPSPSSSNSYSYVVVGPEATISELDDSCKPRLVAWFSSDAPIFKSKSGTISSFSDIHESLLYGFELLWDMWYYQTIYCRRCVARNGYCDLTNDNQITCLDTCDSLNFPTWQNMRHLWRWMHTLWRWMHTLWRCKHVLWRDYYPENRNTIVLIIIIILSKRFLCGIILLLILLWCKWRRRHLSSFGTIEDFLQNHNNLMPIRYTYSDIRKMTTGFKDKLGEGGCGTVYKAKLRSGHFAAVKMLGKSKATGQDFINEVATIGRIHHVNVVHLVGFCASGSKRALVYDFMPNGSLDKYIFAREGNNVSLSCEKMYQISLGVARGIEYLHRGCDIQILHFDIKPHNILLDANFVPKVSDFGLAKLYSTEDSIVSLTAARGTIGYMAPELFYKNIGGVSFKADVYSFGMLLMEMASRRRNLNALADQTSQIYFPSWVYDQFIEGKEVEMGATTDEEREMVRKMIIVASWCIQLKPSDRPSMSKVVEMLEEDVQLLHMPPKPFLCPQDMPAEEQRTNTTPSSDFPVSSGDFIYSVTSDIIES